MHLNIRIIFLSVAIATFAIAFPFEILNTGKQQDFNIYVTYFNDSFYSKFEIFDFAAPLDYLKHEVLWDLILRYITGFSKDAFIALVVISFVTYFFWAIYLTPRVPLLVALVFIFNPISIDIASSILRNGFSWSILIIGLALSRWRIKYFFYCAAPFIHTTACGFLICIIPSILINKFHFNKVLGLISIGFFPIFLGLSLTVFNEFFLGGIGDKHTGNLHLAGNGSWFLAAYFIALLFFQGCSSIQYIKKHAISMSLIIWYLVMNFYVPWAYRIWAAAIPLIAYAVWSLNRPLRNIMLLAWCNLSAYLYYLRVDDLG